MIRLIFCVLSLAFVIPVFARYATLGDEKKLERLSIVLVGNVEKFEYRDGNRVTTKDRLKLGRYCFEQPGNLAGYWPYYGKAGMLLTDGGSRLTLAVFESGVAGRIKVHALSVIEAPCSPT